MGDGGRGGEQEEATHPFATNEVENEGGTGNEHGRGEHSDMPDAGLEKDKRAGWLRRPKSRARAHRYIGLQIPEAQLQGSRGNGIAESVQGELRLFVTLLVDYQLAAEPVYQ